MIGEFTKHLMRGQQQLIKLIYFFKTHQNAQNNNKLSTTMSINNTPDVWIMKPNHNSIMKQKYHPRLVKDVLPDGFECRCWGINDIWDYIAVFYEREECGEYNKSAKWIAKQVPVPPTGSFVIMRKNWDFINKEEMTVDIGMTVQELNQFIKNGIFPPQLKIHKKNEV